MNSSKNTIRRPERSGMIQAEAVPMLDVASLVASRDRTRPALTHILWEGLSGSTRIVATDTYRLFVAQVKRTRAGIKPGPGKQWGIDAQTWRDTIRRQGQRRAVEVGLTLDGDTCQLSASGETAEWEFCEPIPWASWAHVMPREDPVWGVQVSLAELSMAVNEMRKLYREQDQPTVTWWYLDGGELAIVPDTQMRDRNEPPQQMSRAVEAKRVEQSGKTRLVLDLERLHDVLGRLAFFCGDEVVVQVRVRGELEPVEVVIPGCGLRMGTRLIVMPMMKIGEPWTEEPKEEG